MGIEVSIAWKNYLQYQNWRTEMLVKSWEHGIGLQAVQRL